MICADLKFEEILKRMALSTRRGAHLDFSALDKGDVKSQTTSYILHQKWNLLMNNFTQFSFHFRE